MSYLLSVFWLWLVVALLGGGIVGWVTCGPDDKPRFGGWLPYGGAVFAVALAVALLRLLSGTAALWLETALLFFTAYILGCCLGAFLCSRRQAQSPLAASPAFAAVAPVAAAVVEPTNIAPAKPVQPVPADDEPAVAPPVADEAKHAGRRPAGLVSPRGGKADNLKLIRGIGPQNEGRLHALGIWHFSQIAAWTSDEVGWVGSYLAFPGRIEREDWRGQAGQLASGRSTDFAVRAARGEVATSQDDGSAGQSNIAKLDPARKRSRKKS